MLAIADSSVNIHPARQATPKMDPVVMENEMKARLPDGRTMDYTHITILHLQGLIIQARHIHISPKMQTAPLISLGVQCDDGCTTTIDKQEISNQNNGKEITKGTINKKTVM